MDFDLSAILKLYNDDIDFIDNLIHGVKVKYKNYIMYYIRPKFFQIAKGHKTLTFTDLFYVYNTSLEKASDLFLNKHKIDTIDGNKLNTDLIYWINNLNDIIKYCIKDCKLTAELGNFLLSQMNILDLPVPRYFSSKASLAKQYFRLNCRIPNLNHIPLNILDIGYFTYYGGRFEILQRGSFSKLFYYDINSAYPSTIKYLPSLKYGKWIKTDTLPKNEIIGFYKVLLDIPESYISTFPIRDNGIVLFPHGLFETWLTWYDLDLIRDYILDIDYGYEYYPYANREYYPFEKHIDILYDKKREFKGKNEVFYMIYKILMNSLYGCFYERHKDIDDKIYSGILFNPIYATIITARTRWQLLHDIKKEHWKNIIAFHTDSVISNIPLPELKVDLELGNWSLETVNKGIVLLTGIYQIGSELRTRGFKAKLSNTKSINWYTLLQENYDKDFITLPYVFVLKIAESLRRFKNIEHVNKFYNDNRTLYVNSDKKRNWNRDFENCNDVLNNNISSKTIGLKYFLDVDLK